MPPLSLWSRRAKASHACHCNCSRVVVQHPKHQPHECSRSPGVPSTRANRDDDGLILFRITEISGVRLSSISVNPRPSNAHPKEKKHHQAGFFEPNGSSSSASDHHHRQQQSRRKGHSIFTSSMRSLHMAKDKLKAKLHAVGIAASSPSSSSGSGGFCRSARTFSSDSDSAHHRSSGSSSRRMRSNSLGRGGVFRSRKGSGGGHQGGKGAVPLTPSSSMIFIDCPE